MDRARGKRLLEEDVEVLTNIDSDESDAKDDEWSSILRRSKEDYDSLQQEKGAKTSNDALKRSRPATLSGAGVLSITPLLD
ncbi:hypothetical protein TIFTF001_020507 [Ficus carica]|uniref:Uncharacterized protein n=1 Tax=Ficus carica TaxID=3494 RepID=A0AA88AY18_FICCA|nr:hypothetical protein TIFTF001_020507 [Ficus carica]